MVAAGERAFVYAKASGILGKSFVGRRISALYPVGRLSELDRLVFSSRARDLPEKELLPDLERRLQNRSAASIVSLVNCLKHPPALLVLLVRSYEYADLKTALALLNEGGIAGPLVTALGRFASVHFEAWPDLNAMLKGTDYEFVLKVDAAPESGGKDTGNDGTALLMARETALDKDYYRGLWKALFKLKKSDRIAAEKITREEISLRNAAWALRLRTYYGMRGDEVKTHFVDIPGHEELTADALAALAPPLDSRAEWAGWKRLELLNDEMSDFWRADPRYFQNAAAERLYRLALHHFRLRPLSLDALFCFIKLKQFEEDLLTSAAEGLGLGMQSREVFDLLERNVP